jgi:hypothetical protein
MYNYYLPGLTGKTMFEERMDSDYGLIIRRTPNEDDIHKTWGEKLEKLYPSEDYFISVNFDDYRKWAANNSGWIKHCAIPELRDHKLLKLCDSVKETLDSTRTLDEMMEMELEREGKTAEIFPAVCGLELSRGLVDWET